MFQQDIEKLFSQQYDDKEEDKRRTERGMTQRNLNPGEYK